MNKEIANYRIVREAADRTIITDILKTDKLWNWCKT